MATEDSTGTQPATPASTPKAKRNRAGTYVSAPTRHEIDSISRRISDVRCAIELASHAACSADAEEQSKVAGVLDLAVRELQWMEDMLDPVGLQRQRASQGEPS